MPSLNEREDDIPILSEYFLKQVCEEHGMPLKSYTEKALLELKKIKWTGNIRELRNVVERLAIMCDKIITDNDVLLFAQPLRR